MMRHSVAIGVMDPPPPPPAGAPTLIPPTLTLHLVIAGFTVGDLSGTYRMTGLIQQLLDIIGSHNGVEIIASAEEAAQGADIVITSLPNGGLVKQVLEPWTVWPALTRLAAQRHLLHRHHSA